MTEISQVQKCLLYSRALDGENSAHCVRVKKNGEPRPRWPCILGLVTHTGSDGLYVT